MNMSSRSNISVQQLENDKKQLLEYIFEMNSQVLKYSKYSIINDTNFLSLDVEELIQFLKKSSPLQQSIHPPTQHPPLPIIPNKNILSPPYPSASPPLQPNYISPTNNNSIVSPLTTTNNNSLYNDSNKEHLIKSPQSTHSSNSSTSSNGSNIANNNDNINSSSNNQIKQLLPENYGILSKDQFHFASYETYLLICHFSRSNDTIDLEKEETFRIQNEISKVKHDGFIRALSPPPSSSSPAINKPPPFNSITYRLWLLRNFNFNLFDTHESLLIWLRRHLYIILASFSNLIRYNNPYDEKDNSTINQLKLFCYNLEISFQQDPPPQSNQDSTYLTPFNNLDYFIGSLIIKSPLNNDSPTLSSIPNNSQQPILATKYLNKSIPYQFPLNTNLFEDLLFYSLFEFNDDDGTIKFIGDEHFRVSTNLKPFSVALKITPTMETICQLNCFLLAYHTEPNERHLKRLQLCLNTIQSLIEHSSALIQDPNTSAGPLLKATLKNIAQWLVKFLSDVHCYKGSTPTKDIGLCCSIYVQSREMWNCLSSSKTSTPLKTSESSFVSFITSSVSKHYQRLSQQIRPLTLENFSEFVEGLMEEVKLNLNVYTSGFKEFNSKSKMLALTEFVNLYSTDLKEVFADVYFLSPMLIKSVQSASNFQIMLEKFDLISKESLPPVKTYVSSVIGTWCQNQEKDFNKWFENIFKLDKFTPLDKDVRHSSSVVDMFTMFYQTISTLAKMKGSLSDNFPAFILTLSALFNANCLLTYNSQIEQMTMCNQSKQTTLYPNSLNEKIQNKSKLRKSISTSSNQISSQLQSSLTVSKAIPDPNQTVIQTKLQTMTLQKLCICVNNLDYILLNINTYINEHSFNNEMLRGKLKELFSATQITITDTLKSLVDFIGTRVVFYDCKQSIVEAMYVAPLNQKDRISDILESLSPHLKTIYNSTQSLDRGNDILASVSRSFLQAMEYCLLYGGPTRHFQPKDAELIEYDLELAKDFFLDRDDNGVATAVSDELFESYVTNLRKVVQLLMDLSSDILIEQYDSKGKSQFSKETILCVLVHRNDKPSRSFIKKKLNDPHYLSIKKNTKINFLS
ncbi:hypothetical protein RB653_006620 [Dictyostelium firmibasis]|uniref:Uncharacterized protein n=1 Tax=Dictyostelium firmibasis TaxID=79012 RepID=A0AAN7TTC5_9MYCE